MKSDLKKKLLGLLVLIFLVAISFKPIENLYLSHKDFHPGFNKIPDMNFPRYGHTATLLNNGQVLIVGGQGTNGEIELFEPNSRHFRVLDYKYPQLFVGHTATLLSNREILFLNTQGAHSYNVESQRIFPVKSKMHHPRTGHTATLLKGGKVVITGGWSSEGADAIQLDNIEIYDSKTSTFIDSGKLLRPRANHTAIKLDDNRIIIIGGTPLIEIYDPYSRKTEPLFELSFTPAQPFSGDSAFLDRHNNLLIFEDKHPGIRLWSFNLANKSIKPILNSDDASKDFHSINLVKLPSGEIMINGSFLSDGTDKVSIFSINEKKLLSTVHFGMPRTGFTSSVLNNNNILITGGIDANGFQDKNFLRSAEIFNISK